MKRLAQINHIDVCIVPRVGRGRNIPPVFPYATFIGGGAGVISQQTWQERTLSLGVIDVFERDYVLDRGTVALPEVTGKPENVICSMKGLV